MPVQHSKQIVPFEIKDLDPETNKLLLKDFTGERRKFVQAGVHKYLLPSRYAEEAADFYFFKLRSDDVWISTYPRSGTTLTQELIWMVANHCDFETSNKIPLVRRFPFLEGSIQSDAEVMAEVFEQVRGDKNLEEIACRYGESKVPELDAMTTRRFIKTHLPFSLLPSELVNTCKVVYVARNPKDMVVSYYHHNRLLRALGYTGDFPTYYHYFENNYLAWSPYWEHIKEAWALRDHPNMLFLFYEDIIKDLSKTIRVVAKFLNKELSEDQVSALAKHLHIDNFRVNLSVNLDVESLPGLRVPGEQNFIRKGKVGGWKSDGFFTPELNARADKWIQENMATIPDFAFPI